MPHVTARNIQFYYQQKGTGPDVLLIHGITGNLAVWMLSGLVQKLAKQFRVTAFDMRGHGYSDTPEFHYTSSDMADDVQAVCEALAIKDVRLLGHSYGAVVALHAASKYPSLVEGVILSDPFVPALHKLQPDPRNWKGFNAYKTNARSAGMFIDGNLWDLKEMLEQAASLTGARKALFIKKAGEASLERLVRLHGTTCGSDVARIAGLTEETIGRIQQNAVCLYGEHSPFLPMCEGIGQLLPNCSMDRIPKAQHFAFEENPLFFIDRVEQHFCDMTGLQPTGVSEGIELQRKNIMTDSDSV
ncbi:MAG: alpha/beta hydrolase [Planctomycetota bacterium]|nr:alpha/beta hydrolase [Planctomycetota bacterium]